MGKVTVTYEFNSVEEAIASLGKQMGGAPGARLAATEHALSASAPPGAPATRTRKPRNDAGKPRGPYKEPAAPAEAPSAPLHTSPELPETAPAVAAAPTPAPASPAEGDKPQPSGTSAPAAGVPSTEDAREVFAKVFDTKGIVCAKDLLMRYGVGRVGELLPAQRQGFIDECNGLLRQTSKAAA